MRCNSWSLLGGAGWVIRGLCVGGVLVLLAYMARLVQGLPEHSRCE